MLCKKFQSLIAIQIITGLSDGHIICLGKFADNSYNITDNTLVDVSGTRQMKCSRQIQCIKNLSDRL